ncbi:MAG: nucleoside monophosphate kinase [Amoebophilaceae bacterium]|nr:nucleoside monophosphate kinase [Amoebophilaceae bacterium]
MAHIILFGPPGCGKGTQAKKLTAITKYNFVCMALGDLLRKQISENAVHKATIEQYIRKGQLVPDSLSFEVVEDFIQKQAAGVSFLFDGFPRNIPQAIFLDNLLAQYKTQIEAAIFLEVEKKYLLERLQSRAVKEGRLDDQDLHTIQTRMELYEQETLPIANYYERMNKLYKVDGMRASDQVTETIEGIINGLK